VPRNVRERWLLAAGYSRSEIAMAERQAKRIRLQRQDSAKYFDASPLHVIVSKMMAPRKNEATRYYLDDDDGSNGWL
jgi:hypothetical protein